MVADSENALKFNLVRADDEREFPWLLSAAGRPLREEPCQHRKQCVKASNGIPRSQWTQGKAVR